MSKFNIIDIEHWERKEFYLHYINEVNCSYSVTVELDITPLKEQKLYPAMIYLLTNTVNEFEQFRMCIEEDGLGVFETMNPSYTVFNAEHKNFSSIWTPYCSDYSEFLKQYQEDVEQYSKSIQFAPKKERPHNCFDISMIPWLTFTAFNINVFSANKHLLPIFTMGKYYERDGKRVLPLSIQVHHSVCDGYHVAMFVKSLQDKINNKII